VKHRSGITGCVKLAFNKSLTKFQKPLDHPSGLNMNLPEYLDLFSNVGSIDVIVKFEDSDVVVAPQKMQPQELAAFVATEDFGFQQRMTFDAHPFSIRKYEIDPIKNRLTIFARKIL
jgi:hypothetical protein